MVAVVVDDITEVVALGVEAFTEFLGLVVDEEITETLQKW
jgi:hypothetical protein